MGDIRSDIASFFAAARDQYAGGVPLSLIRPRGPQKILFLSDEALSDSERALVTDIAVKGLKLSQSHYEIRDGAQAKRSIISENYGVIHFGGCEMHPRTLNAPPIRELEASVERKKQFWNALKQFAIRGYS